jgi:hypothetical protein
MNRIGKVTAAVLLWAGALAMGSLEIYNDGVKYRYVPVDDYVGFVRGAKALCGEREITLLTRQECPEAKRLCKEAQEIVKLRVELESVRDSLAMVRSWTKSARPGDIDAAKWIGAAEKMGKRLAEWKRRKWLTETELKGRERHFQGQVSGDKPLFLSRLCKDELELTLPPGVIDIRLINVAELEGEKIRVSHYLALRNHSGVDISSKDARIYVRDYHRNLSPVRFIPWVVRPVREPVLRKRVRKKEERLFEAMDAGMGAPAPVLPTPKRLGYRDYAVGKIELPSTGEEVRVRINGYEVPRKCEELSFPWRDPSVYVACRFVPKTAVENSRWILKRGRRVISESAYGEYDGGKYLLFVDRDDAVKIRRRPVVEKERSSGIFGGKIKKKDGYVLEFENRSDRQKTVKIIERIPASTTEAIKVKLLELKGAIRESLDDEEGKLVMQVVLAPREHKEVKVLFELSYDKDLKIRY